jgi:hypothetical protein
MALSTTTEWHSTTPPNREVEIGNSLEIIFKCYEDDVLTAADSTTVRLVSTGLSEIETYTPTTEEVGIYDLVIPFTSSVVEPDTEYYLEISWTLDGVTKLVRDKIRVVKDTIR